MFDEKLILESLATIAAFEKKQISAADYKKFVTATLKIKDAICDGCTDVMDRLHSDFQKRVNREIETKFTYLKKEISFKSGKYSNGGFYVKTVPNMSFQDLRKTLSVMKRDIVTFGARGLKEQVKLISEDMKLLERYISEKLNGCGVSGIEIAKEDFKAFVNTTKELTDEEIQAALELANNFSNKELIGHNELAEIPSELGVGNEESHIEEDSKEETKEVETAKETESTTEKTAYSNEDAIKMQDSGMTLAEIGEYFGISAPTVSRRLKEFKEAQ